MHEPCVILIASVLLRCNVGFSLTLRSESCRIVYSYFPFYNDLRNGLPDKLSSSPSIVSIVLLVSMKSRIFGKVYWWIKLFIYLFCVQNLRISCSLLWILCDRILSYIPSDMLCSMKPFLIFSALSIWPKKSPHAWIINDASATSLSRPFLSLSLN